jgi:hypothetical protein
VPPLDHVYEGSPALYQREKVCDLVACPADSRHRRQHVRERAALREACEPDPGRIAVVR